MSNSIAPGSSADVNVKVTALTTNPNVPVTYKTVILKKNLVNGVNTLTQEMMSTTNTKYIIKYNYILGENITVPVNCVLEFDGGSISGNTIDFNYCEIIAPNYHIFKNIGITRNIQNAFFSASWFGLKGDSVTNNSTLMQNMLDIFKDTDPTKSTNNGCITIKFPSGEYIFNSSVEINTNGLTVEGEQGTYFKANDSFANDSGILIIGNNSSSTRIIIKSITFTKYGADYFNSKEPYNSTKYGANLSVSHYEQSCAGLLMYDSHECEIIECEFHYLRLGVGMFGSWSSRIKDCQLSYNNRNIQMMMNEAGNGGCNDMLISNCKLSGASINGGTSLFDVSGILIERCSFEENKHTALCMQDCDTVKLQNCFFEANVFAGKQEENNDVYKTTPFYSNRMDSVPLTLDGRDIAINTSKNINIDSCLFPGIRKPLDNNIYVLDNSAFISVTNSLFTGWNLVDGCYMSWESAENNYSKKYSFVIDNCKVDPIWKTTDKIGSVITIGSGNTYDSYITRRNFFIDLDNGNDNISISQNDSNHRIKSLRNLLISLPANFNKEVYINIIGGEGGDLMIPYHGVGGLLYFKFDSNTAYNKLSIPNSNNIFEFHHLNVQTILNDIYDSTNDAGLDKPWYNKDYYNSPGIYEFIACTLDLKVYNAMCFPNYSKIIFKNCEMLNNIQYYGLGNLERGSEYIFDGCNLHENNIEVSNLSKVKCINTTINTSSTPEAEVYRALKPVGTTQQRPSNPPLGYQFFDTSLSPARPIYWNGTAWVDATGNAV